MYIVQKAMLRPKSLLHDRGISAFAHHICLSVIGKVPMISNFTLYATAFVLSIVNPFHFLLFQRNDFLIKAFTQMSVVQLLLDKTDSRTIRCHLVEEEFWVNWLSEEKHLSRNIVVVRYKCLDKTGIAGPFFTVFL